MSYKIKNKNIALIAVMFMATMAFSQTGYAQVENAPAETPAAQDNQSLEQSDDLFGLDEEEPVGAEAVQTKADDAADAPALNSADANPESNSAPQAENEAKPEEPADAGLTDEAKEPQPDSLNNISADDVKQAQGDLNADLKKSQAADKDAADADLAAEAIAEAPKSPFESFGNTILSKVDNSLFNQMSNIEKQTTILNLEYKREEVRNRIEALRMQRLKARQEEAARQKAEEERLKEEENQRKIKELGAQEKLRKAEMELEKVRQARVLNEYMNEMLITNQKWVEKNAALQNQVKELRDERRTLIKNFETQVSAIRREVSATVQKAENAKAAHERVVASLETQIKNLKKTIMQSEETLQQLKNGNSANPFAEGIDEDAIDMSDEYAIMDITGKGKDIIAKILNKEGTTFIVHVGSMLKGGEVVTAITDNYIAFDNKGAKSYLYTGGTVREYEPESSFNGADKTPIAASGVINRNAAIKNVRGAVAAQTKNSGGKAAHAAPAESNNGSSDRPKRKTASTGGGSGIGSLGQGMFVK